VIFHILDTDIIGRLKFPKRKWSVCWMTTRQENVRCTTWEMN